LLLPGEHHSFRSASPNAITCCRSASQESDVLSGNGDAKADDVPSRIDAKSKCVRAGRRVDGSELSVAQEKSVLCAGAVLVTANDIAGVVDPECLGLHRVGKIELGEPAVGAPHKAMLNARSRGGERTDNRAGLVESDGEGVGHIRLRIGEGQDVIIAA